MTKSLWADPILTGAPLDYVPVDSPEPDDRIEVPERPSRLVGHACFLAAVILGVLLGVLIS